MPSTHTNAKQFVLISDSAEIYVTGLSKIVRTVSTGYGSLHAKHKNEIETILKHSKVDLILFEVNLFSGPLIYKIRNKYPQVKMLGYGNIRNCKIIKDFVTKGLNGYVLKNDPKKEFTTAIREVQSGKKYFSRDVMEIFSNRILNQRDTAEEFFEDMRNMKFREILYLIYHEFSIKEIASEMGLAEKTIEGYRSRLLKIVGANNMVGLALFAERHQIHYEKDLRSKFNVKERAYVEI
jgi:DNA-binding NarL/FixJ family response regulator